MKHLLTRAFTAFVFLSTFIVLTSSQCTACNTNGYNKNHLNSLLGTNIEIYHGLNVNSKFKSDFDQKQESLLVVEQLDKMTEATSEIISIEELFGAIYFNQDKNHSKSSLITIEYIQSSKLGKH